MTSDQSQMEKTASIRARLKFETESEFIEKYAPNVSKTGIFIKTSSLRPIGTRVVFEFQLADGQTVLKGLGEVSWHSDKQSNKSLGMGIKLIKLDRKSKEIIEKCLLLKSDKTKVNTAAQPTIPETQERETPAVSSISTEPLAEPLAAPLKVAEPSPAEVQDKSPLTIAADTESVISDAHADLPFEPPRKQRRRETSGIDLNEIDSMLAEIDTAAKPTRKRRPTFTRDLKVHTDQTEPLPELAQKSNYEPKVDVEPELGSQEVKEPEPEPLKPIVENKINGIERISQFLAEEIQNVDINQLLEDTKEGPFEQFSEPPLEAPYDLDEEDSSPNEMPNLLPTGSKRTDKEAAIHEDSVEVRIKGGPNLQDFDLLGNMDDLYSNDEGMESLLENGDLQEIDNQIFSTDEMKTSMDKMAKANEPPETLPDEAIPPGLVRERLQTPPAPPVFQQPAEPPLMTAQETAGYNPEATDASEHEKLTEDTNARKKKSLFKKFFG